MFVSVERSSSLAPAQPLTQTWQRLQDERSARPGTGSRRGANVPALKRGLVWKSSRKAPERGRLCIAARRTSRKYFCVPESALVAPQMRWLQLPFPSQLSLLRAVPQPAGEKQLPQARLRLSPATKPPARDHLHTSFSNGNVKNRTLGSSHRGLCCKKQG